MGNYARGGYSLCAGGIAQQRCSDNEPSFSHTQRGIRCAGLFGAPEQNIWGIYAYGISGRHCCAQKALERVSALLAGLLTALLVVTGFNATPAMAANGTVDVEFPGGSANHNGQPVFVEGESYTLTIKYNRDVIPAGHVAKITVPKGFTINEAPAANTAVESFALENGTLTIKFKDPIPVSNGAIDLVFTVDTRTESSEETVVWDVNGNETSQTIIFKDKDDDIRNVDDAGWKDGRELSFPAAVVDDKGNVVLDPEAFLNKEASYIIQVHSKQAREVVIADTLAAGMSLVPGSFSLYKTWWDAKGMNRQSATVDIAGYEGTSFSHTISAEQNSMYTLEYKAKITDAAALAQLRDALQAQYDALKNKNGEVPEGAAYAIELKNTATIAGAENSKSYSIQGETPTAPKPGIGKAFKKSTELPQNTKITLKEDGVTLDPAVPVTYKFRADLTQFADFVGTKHELKRNVVITDDLPKNLEWLLADPNFISKPFEFVPAVSAAEFAGDEYVGKYMVDDQTLRINVGKDTSQKFEIKVQAELVSVEHATKTDDPEDNPYFSAMFTGIRNNAHFKYDETEGYSSHVDHSVGISKKPGDSVNDKTKFSKQGNSEPLVLEEGQTIAELPYTFTVGEGIGDAAKSTVVDHVDHELLDVSAATLPQIQKSITGTYDGTSFDLDGSSFKLSLNEANDLVFTPTDAFPLANGSTTAAKPLLKGYTFTVMLPTKPLTGKETVVVKNSASYFGEDTETVFTSKSQSSAGVGGREIDVKKTVFNPAKDEFTTNLRAELNADGTLVSDEFVYRVEFIPTLGYSKMLYDISDQLVDNLEFVGFVNPDQVKGGATAGKGDYRIPGTELTATFNEADNRITVAKNQKITGGKVTELFFKVKIKDFVDGEGVENAIGPEKVTITPTNDMPLDISKINEIDPTGDPITDRDARFELRDAAGKVVIEDMYIVGGKLRFESEKAGKKFDAVPTVKTAGTYTVHELKAPEGFVKKTEPVVLVVDEDGTSQETKFFNTPRSAVKKVSVGDYVWLDANRDGIQDAGETPIEGVKLKLTGPNGQPVSDIDGNAVEPTVTDANGFYEFTDLPALEEGQTYTVSIVQDDKSTVKALEGLVPTKENGTDDRALDSSTWTAVSRDDLVNDGDRDPTLDFGFHSKSVSVGDYVWLDIDRDGIQGTNENEAPIQGVKLVLTGPDGKPVTDVFGNEVKPEVTNDKGFYEFTNLPALKDGETYTVSIDREDDGTKQALEGLVPTKTEGTDDREKDSSKWTAVSRDDLVNDGDKDYSLDFGFKSKSVSVGDYVWLDVDRDGVQGTDKGEAPIQGVKLVLTGPDGKPVTDVFGNEVKPEVTNDKGFYEFTNLPALKDGQTYTVSIDREDDGTKQALEGLVPTKTEGTDDRELDSSEWTAVSRDDLVKNGDKDYSLDFGFHSKSVSVGDYVWLDVDGDGVQGTDKGEAPIQGVKLVLTGPDGKTVTDVFGNEVKPVVTDKDGFYEFTDLPALKDGETYTVTIDQDDDGTQQALEGLVPTKTNGTDDPALDSSTWTAVSRDDLVNDGDRDPTLDFGFRGKSVSVGDYVWLDYDRDGVQGTDKGEAPIQGVKLVLTGPDGKPVTDVFGNEVAPVVTNDEGFYEFTDLPALKAGETYTVSIDREDKGTQKALEGLVPTKTEGTDDREKDSSKWTAVSRDDLVNDGDKDYSLDFGFHSKKVSVGDYVWLDVDGDGVQGTSPDEKPLPGVKLIVTGPNGKPVTDVFGNEVKPVVTDENGFYEFTDLPALKDGETYTVTIDQDDEGTQKALEGLIPTKVEGTDNRELDSSEWTAESRTDLVNDGDRDPSLDFGFKPKTYAIGDVVWIDADKDGLQGETEHTLKDVIVRLFDEQGTLVAETTTDENGLYVFDELRAGKYRVQFELTPAQAKLYSFTKTDGGDTSLDSNAGAQGFSTWIVLDDSNAELTLDYQYGDLVGGIKATQGIDPTWDAGVIVNETTPVVPGVTPEQPEGSVPLGKLPATGGSFEWGYAAGAAGLLVLGAGALLLARRRNGQNA